MKAHLIICFVLFSSQIGFALEPQTSPKDTIFTSKMDIIDIGLKFFPKAKWRLKDTSGFSFRKMNSALLPGLNYSLQTNLAYSLNYVGGINLTNNPNANQSSLNITMIYTQLNQFLVPIVANIWTKDDKYNIQLDWRYLIFPQTTYGLGSTTQQTSGYTLNFTNIRSYSTLYKPVSKFIYLGVGYSFDYLYNVHEINPVPGLTDFQAYNQLNHISAPSSISSAPTISFLIDTRKNSINPSSGAFVNIVYRNNLTQLGSSQNWQSLVVDARKYYSLSSTKNRILSFWTYNWFTLQGATPYILLPYTAGDPLNNTARGFAEARLRGINMLYLESEYRFEILKNGLLGGVVFSNIESFSNLYNHFDGINYAYGAGLRIKINKYAKTNAAIDYAFGTNGSRGIFLNLGEVF